MTRKIRRNRTNTNVNKHFHQKGYENIKGVLQKYLDLKPRNHENAKGNDNGPIKDVERKIHRE